jgi:hypothetical protein
MIIENKTVAENNYPPLSPFPLYVAAAKISRINVIQAEKKYNAMLSPNMLIIGHPNRTAPKAKRNIQISFIGIIIYN